MTPLAITLAAIGACAYAIGARLQNGAVRGMAPESGLGPKGLLRLVRANRWLLGLLSIAIGAVLHAVALGLAPLIVVQPVGVLAVPLTAVLNARAMQLRLNRTSMVAIASSALGVSLFVWLTASTAITTAVAPDIQLTAAELVLGGVAVLTLIAVLSSNRIRCLAFAAGCGVCYGFVSFLMHGVTLQLRLGGVTALTVLPILGIIVSLLVGAWLLQLAHASGPPDVVVASMTVVDPLVAVGIGIGLLGEAAHASPATVAGEVLCALMACGGVIGLSRNHPEVAAAKAAKATTTTAGSSSTESMSTNGNPIAHTGDWLGSRRETAPTEAPDDLAHPQQHAAAARHHRRGNLSP